MHYSKWPNYGAYLGIREQMKKIWYTRWSIFYIKKDEITPFAVK
jgi:hypothetical protein